MKNLIRSKLKPVVESEATRLFPALQPPMQRFRSSPAQTVEEKKKSPPINKTEQKRKCIKSQRTTTSSAQQKKKKKSE